MKINRYVFALFVLFLLNCMTSKGFCLVIKKRFYENSMIYTSSFLLNPIETSMNITFDPPLYIKGTLTLADIFQMISERNINVSIEPEAGNPELTYWGKIASLEDLAEKICKPLDLWCLSKDGQTIEVRRTINIVLERDKEGNTSFSVGGAGGSSSGESGGSEGSGTGESGGDTGGGGAGSSGGGSGATLGKRSVSYNIKNVSFNEVLTLMTDYLKIPFIPSEEGFFMFKVTPKQYDEVVSYFKEIKSRKKPLLIDVRLYRVDLNKTVKYGINWDNLAKKAFTIGSVNTVASSFNFNNIAEGENQARFGFITKAGEERAVVSALEEYGKVHKVDNWHYNIVTGSIIPFSNYQLIRYFSYEIEGTGEDTVVRPIILQDEVGFKGVITVTKKREGYVVEGSIDLSTVTGWIEVPVDNQGHTIKAPNISGKFLRIHTILPDLNKTLVLGGFRSKGFEKKDYGVPILKSIPILGYLFKGKTDQDLDSEFVVLISIRSR